MLGKAMRFATVCTLAFAICGKANRAKGAADSEGTTEDLEHRLMQEANFEDHLSNTTNVSSTLLWKPSSKRLAVIGALTSALTADAFTSPGVQPSGIHPFQNDMLRPVNVNRANPNLATPQVSSKSALFSEEEESASSGSFYNDFLASPPFDEIALEEKNAMRKKYGLPFDEIAFEKKNVIRKKYGLKPFTLDEFMQIEAKVEEMESVLLEMESAVPMSDPGQFLEDSLAAGGVVVFSKIYCPYCQRCLKHLRGVNTKMTVHQLDQLGEPYHGPVQQALQKKGGVITVPQVFINSQFFGDAKDVDEKVSSGTLVSDMRGAGAEFD